MKSRLITVFFLSFITQSLVSQTLVEKKKILEETNVEKLKALKNRFNSTYESLKKKAVELNISLETISIDLQKKGTLNSIKNGVPFYDFDDNINAAITARIDHLWDDGSTGLNLNGSGIIIGHWEASGVALTVHNELIGRVQVMESASSSSHATHTAGTMIATGSNSLARGMANAAIIQARKSNNDETEMTNFAISGGILSNHSYSSNNPDGNTRFYGYYSAHSKDWDEIAYNAPFYTICKSAGNIRNDGVNTLDNGFDTMFSQALSKNIITVGAVENVPNYTGPSSVIITSFSSFGPTDDGRIKPDIVSNGQDIFSSESANSGAYGTKSGTSMAAPVVTGSIALLQEHYNSLNNAFMKSATVKALLIGSADEAGEHLGPDFSFGWGLLNAKKAAEIISDKDSKSIIHEAILADQQTYQFSVELDGNTPLDLTLVWTDLPGTPLDESSFTEDQSDSMLVNDLDVRVTGNGNTYMPWVLDANSFTSPAVKGDNFKDNVERVNTEILPAGTYIVTVSHKGQLFNTSDQEFSIVVNSVSSSTLSSELFESNRFVVYPNPVVGRKLHIKTPQGFTDPIGISLYDLRGRLLFFKSITQKVNTPSTIDLNVVNSGVYILKLTSKNGKSEYQKIIVD